MCTLYKPGIQFNAKYKSLTSVVHNYSITEGSQEEGYNKFTWLKEVSEHSKTHYKRCREICRGACMDECYFIFANNKLKCNIR